MPSTTTAEFHAAEAGPIDEAIGRMERLYQSMTGREAPPADTVYAPIPVERNPGEYVDEQMNRLLERLGSAPTSPWSATEPTPWAPPLSICESGAEIVVRVDLPGIPRDRLRVTMNGNALTISGIRNAPEPAGETVRLSEVPFGAFRRVVVLAGTSRGAEPAARMKEGVLEVRIPRESPQQAAERDIPIH